MKDKEFRLILHELRRIGDSLETMHETKAVARVITPPPDTIPPKNPNEPPGIPGPIEPPPIDRTA